MQNAISSSGTLLSSDIHPDSSLLQCSGESVSYNEAYPAAPDVTASDSLGPLGTVNSSIALFAGVENSYKALSAYAEEFDITQTHLFQAPDMFDDLSLLPVISEDPFGGGDLSSILTPLGESPSEDFLFANHRHLTLLSRIEALNRIGKEPVPRAPRAFTLKRVRYRQLSLNRKFVICTLSAYPHMMLPDKAMPPFIHPRCLAHGSSQDGRVVQALPGPLATCAGIIALWSVKNKTNNVFIWRAIRAEQERLLEEADST